MKVIVIDDSKTVRTYHKQLLVESGLVVDEAENGMEALEKSCDNSYELFLVDINMPIMDGYSFVKEIREKEPFKPIIMISTEAEKGDMIKAYEAGANIYLIKPVKPNELQSIVKILI